MVSQCVNPQCGKPLHYLRDGKIFLLEVPVDNAHDSTESAQLTAKMEHFWLCGECSPKFVVRQVGSRIEVVAKGRSRRPAEPADPIELPVAS
jgi:hypothetical protein